MESSHSVIFSTSGKFITKFNVLRCISLSETLFWTGARGRIPITLRLFRLLENINVGEHENGRKRQITDGIKRRKEHKFGSEFAKKLNQVVGILPIKKLFGRVAREGGYKQLELAET